MRSSFFASCEDVKRRQAASNLRMLRDWQYLSGEMLVLDVGCSIGLNVMAMRKTGATVIGVEPDREAFEYGCQKGYLDEKVDRCSTLQDLPRDLDGKFDIVTIFLISIDREDLDAVFERISTLLKPDGKLLIGTEVEEYTLHPGMDHYGSPMCPALLKYFGAVNRNKVMDIRDNAQKYVLVCTEPKKLEASSSQPRFYAPLIFFAFNWLMYFAANQRAQAHNDIQPQAMMWLQYNPAFRPYFYNRRIPAVVGFFNKKLPEFNPRAIIKTIFRL